MLTSVSSGSWPAVGALEVRELRFELRHVRADALGFLGIELRRRSTRAPGAGDDARRGMPPPATVAPFCAFSGERLSYDSVKASTTSRSRPVRGSRMGVVTMFTLMSRLRRMSIAVIVIKARVQVVLLRHLAQVAVGEHDALEILHVLVGVAFATRRSPPATGRSTARRFPPARTRCSKSGSAIESRIASSRDGNGNCRTAAPCGARSRGCNR